MTPLSVERFMQAGVYLRNWSPRTVHTYRYALQDLPPTVTKESLEGWVQRLRARGITPGGVNLRIRTVNSFLGWLQEEGVETPPRMRLLKTTLRQPSVLSAEDARLVVVYHPTRQSLKRARALALLLLDTGLRIQEALHLRCEQVDLETMTLRCMGKGNRERLVPFSRELRKTLFQHIHAKNGYVFATRSGEPMSYRNARRDLSTVFVAAGVMKHVHPHLLRHSFACYYLRSGGDLYRLSRLLGHTSVTTTQIYLRAMGIEDLREGHDRRTLLHMGPR